MNKPIPDDEAHRKQRQLAMSKALKEQPAPVSADRPAPRKNPIHSLITTLPVIMLLFGLTIYYIKEGKQRSGPLLFTQMEQLSGGFSGISQQGDKVESQRILWVETSDRLRGIRIDQQQYKKLQELDTNVPLELWAVPRVEGSATLWLVKIAVSGTVLIDRIPL